MSFLPAAAKAKGEPDPVRPDGSVIGDPESKINVIPACF